MTKILLFGSQGFIGTHILRHASNDTDILDIDISGNPKICLDVVSDFSKLQPIVSEFRPDVIINLAAFPSNSACLNSLSHVYPLNVLFPSRLYALAAQLNIPLYIHASSEWIYGIGSQYITNSPSPISFYPNHHDLYSRSKLDSEIRLESEATHSRNETSVLSLRLGIIYGSSTVMSNSVVDKIISEKNQGRSLLLKSPQAARHFISVDSVAQCFLAASSQYKNFLAQPYTSVNIQGSNCYSVSSIQNYINQASPLLPLQPSSHDSSLDIKCILPQQTQLLDCPPSLLRDYLDNYIN